MKALIDGDIVAYRCAASAAEESLEVALERTDNLIERICYETKASSSAMWVSGEDNFRTHIYPEYKANRKNKPRPHWLQAVREHMVVGWNAKVTDGNEADDELGIAQSTAEEETVICTIDKDLVQVPGNHYNFVTGVHKQIDYRIGWQNFYYQLLMGDNSDNIKGFDGIGRSKVPKFLESTIALFLECRDVRDMYEFVQELYINNGSSFEEDMTRMEINAQCLYIQRSIGDEWRAPNAKETLPLNPV